jgi:hypothetical protein
MESAEILDAVRILQEAVLALSERLARLEEALARQNQTLNIVPLQNVVSGVGGE